jgi:hypothetical protein
MADTDKAAARATSTKAEPAAPDRAASDPAPSEKTTTTPSEQAGAPAQDDTAGQLAAATDQARVDREQRAVDKEEAADAAAQARAVYDSPPDAKGPQNIPAAGGDPDSVLRLAKTAEASGVVVDWDATERAARERAGTDGSEQSRADAAAQRSAAAQDTGDSDGEESRSTPPQGRTARPARNTAEA